MGLWVENPPPTAGQLELDASELGICKVISKGEDSNALIAILQEMFASSETPLNASIDLHSLRAGDRVTMRYPNGILEESVLVSNYEGMLQGFTEKPGSRRYDMNEGLRRIQYVPYRTELLFATKIIRQQSMLVTRSKHRPEPRPPTPLASLLHP
jgi:hypothetical protein